MLEALGDKATLIPPPLDATPQTIRLIRLEKGARLPKTAEDWTKRKRRKRRSSIIIDVEWTILTPVYGH